jgi:hypothetical protein
MGAASVNDPIIGGMAVRTTAPARAALGIGATRIALSGATELDIARLDDTTRQIAVQQGRIGIHLTRLDPGETVEIDLPRGGVWLLAPGDYDITTGNDQIPARIAVFAGQAHVAGNGIDRKIAAGSTLVLNAKGAASPTTDSAAADDFVAAWRPAPDALAEPAPLRHVSPQMTGWETLDGAGSWEDAAGFGEVWFPKNLPDDWAPYRYGHWRWVMPWAGAGSMTQPGLRAVALRPLDPDRGSERGHRALGLVLGCLRRTGLHAGRGQFPRHRRDRPRCPTRSEQRWRGSRWRRARPTGRAIRPISS